MIVLRRVPSDLLRNHANVISDAQATGTFTEAPITMSLPGSDDDRLPLTDGDAIGGRSSAPKLKFAVSGEPRIRAISYLIFSGLLIPGVPSLMRQTSEAEHRAMFVPSPVDLSSPRRYRRGCNFFSIRELSVISGEEIKMPAKSQAQQEPAGVAWPRSAVGDRMAA
jgi:hypothetical protein